MPEKLPTLLPDDEPKRDRLRALLTIACVVAVVLAGSVVPAVPGGGLGRTPRGSVVPQHDANVYGPPQSGGGGAGSGSGTAGGLGALNPGDRTSIGGSLAAEDSAFRSQETSVHFTVQSTAPAYWRTGAYDTYTGSGWERSDDRRAYDGSVEGDGIRDREVEYRVSLNRSATALPSVWRPATLSGENGVSEESLFVTDRRAFVTDDPVPAGAAYSGVSHRAPRDPHVLRTAGRDYPDDLERRYTALPDDTDELARFTAQLTADADSTYDAAVQVESWLESNKNYSLDAPKPDGDVASQFVFEMEEGYCEYFATAMTAMLRSQGVPARYAVGYSTGQQVGANTYEVRGMNAHAWVEAYFPDVGWVKFDPTPGSERLQSERQSLANQTEADAGDYEPTEPGSPGEELSPNESADTPTDIGSPPATADGAGEEIGTGELGTDDGAPDGTGTPSAGGTTDGTPPTEGTPATGGDSTATADPDAPTTGGSDSDESDSDSDESDSDESDSDDSESSDSDSSDDESESSTDGGYDVELNRTPVPGATVEVTIRDEGTPASGVAVLFDGERVGTTDEDGTVTAQVPYVRNLTVSVEDVGGGEVASVGDEDEAANAAVEGETASVAVDRDGIGIAAPPPGLDAPMSLSAAPLRSLAVDGRTLQSAPPGNGTGGNGTEYELATDASLAVSGDLAVGNEVVVTATVEDVPVRDGAVLLDGEQVGTTDRSGRAEVSLPDSPGNATLSVERGSVTGETAVTIPRLSVSVDPALPLALPGTSVEVNATYGGEPVSDARVAVADANATTDFDGSATAALPLRRSADVVVSARGQTRQATVSGLLVNLAAVLGGAALVLGGLGYGASRRGYGPRRLAALLVAGARAVPGLAMAVLFGVADWLERAAGRALAALRELRDGESSVRELLARLRAWSSELLAGLAGWLRERLARLRTMRTSATGDGSEAAGSRAPREPAAAPDRDEDSYRTLREAWADFLGVVSVREPGSATPGELAAHAIREDDLPSGEVLTLRDAFRDVEYGARSPADRLPRVERAVEAIEREARDDEPDDARDESGDAPGRDDAQRRDGAERRGGSEREDAPDRSDSERGDAPDEATPPGGDD